VAIKIPDGLLGDTSYTDAVAVAPSNDQDLEPAPQALYVGVPGDIKVTLLADRAGARPVIFNAVPVGLLKIRVRRVWNTGTGADNILALY
jgi:hypothetical protein